MCGGNGWSRWNVRPIKNLTFIFFCFSFFCLTDWDVTKHVVIHPTIDSDVCFNLIQKFIGFFFFFQTYCNL